MRKKNYFTILFAILVVFFMISHESYALQQYTIVNYPSPPYRPQWGGGPFYIVEVNEPTYCIELSEYITLPMKLYGSIDDYAIEGGNLTSHGGGPDGIPGSGKDYLDPWSEYLIANYLSDSLTTQAKMMDFQNALWYIEGELSALPGVNQYYNIVQGIKPTENIARIHVLNLYDNPDGTGNRQSLIINSIPVPEPGTLLLLGAGLLGLTVAVRRRKK